MNVEIKPYFAVGERYPSLIGVRVDRDEYETAYVSKRELVDVLDENTKLRQQLADVTESMSRVEERCAKLRAGTCKEVYLLMATDIGNGREEVLGIYATESAAMKAANDDDNQFGYAFHHVRKWKVAE